MSLRPCESCESHVELLVQDLFRETFGDEFANWASETSAAVAQQLGLQSCSTMGEM